VGGLAYDRVGSGEPVVLLHGLGCRRESFRPVVERLAGERELIATDLPGFGDSPPDPAGTALTVADHSDRIEGFCAELGIDRPHVVGSSMGGGVALELGRRGLSRSVTVFSPIGFWKQAGRRWCRSYLEIAHRLGQRLPEPRWAALDLFFARISLAIPSFGRPFKVPAEEVLGTRDDALAAPGYAGAIEHGLDYDFENPEELRGLPLTVAWGRRDLLLTYLTQSRRARRMLPWARHVPLPRCGHIPFYDDPDLCAAVIRSGTAA